MNDKNIRNVQLVIDDRGVMDYAAALALQLEIVEKRINNEIPNTVIIVEHDPVVTLGARRDENKLRISEEAMAEKGIGIVQVRRGGGSTAHNPGQIVVYPIIKLKSLEIDINEFVRRLEGIGIELLEGMGIRGERKKGAPGIWVEERKIASIGVQVKRWVTYHGLAINIRNDLDIFNTIVPCGMEGVEMTSAEKETGEQWSMDDTRKRVGDIIRSYFND